MGYTENNKATGTVDAELAPAPCPFCQDSENLNIVSNGCESYFVECDNCGASGPVVTAPRLAVEKWNARMGASTNPP